MLTLNARALVLKTGLSLLTVGALLTVVVNKDLVFGYGSSGGGSGVAGVAPVCGESNPGSAPTLLSVVPSGANSLTLNWGKAQDPVTYYLVTYGTQAGEQLYGNPNVGGSDTTSYTINNLSGGKRYYFQVRAGNGCMPGTYSNELSAVAGGRVITGPAVGFEPEVLGAETTKPETTVTPTLNPTGEQTTKPEEVSLPTEQSQEGLLARFIKWLLSLLGR